ncbi:type I restriction endonuclease [Phyllobacterium sp. K27]
MNAVEEHLKILSDRVKSHSSSMATEEAVKTAVVLPFLRALGYDVFDPSEVIPEFTADAVGKKGERVDYAIKIDNKIQILIECKPITTKLEKAHLSQLYRYFSVTEAKFAILSNGRTFNFYTDLIAPNKLDERPFLTFDLSDLQGQLIAELKKFAKTDFDIDGILASAERLKYTSGVKLELSKLMEEPSEEFIKLVAGQVYDGRMTLPVREMLAGVVKTAFREVIMDAVKSRLSSALADTEQVLEQLEGPIEMEDQLVTTDEEIEGYLIVKAIVREILKPSRVHIRDAKSYCAVLVDNNNRKPLVRLHFNRSVKYVGLFDGETEDRVIVNTLDDIYDYTDRLIATASKFVQ